LYTFNEKKTPPLQFECFDYVLSGLTSMDTDTGST
jgi:hypothetical protein